MVMTYNEALVMPSNYAVMDEEEMTYVEGGAAAVVYGTAKEIRTRLAGIIASSVTGTGAMAALGALLGGAGGAVVGTVIANGLYGSYRTYASSAHHKIEQIISKYGKNIICKMTTTYSFAYFCTGISVDVL